MTLIIGYAFLCNLQANYAGFEFMYIHIGRVQICDKTLMISRYSYHKFIYWKFEVLSSRLLGFDSIWFVINAWNISDHRRWNKQIKIVNFTVYHKYLADRSDKKFNIKKSCIFHTLRAKMRLYPWKLYVRTARITRHNH